MELLERLERESSVKFNTIVPNVQAVKAASNSILARRRNAAQKSLLRRIRFNGIFTEIGSFG
ncbi:MAG: hypothetical protein ACM37Z_01515, partial [Deltaproteobacteria bacterium]